MKPMLFNTQMVRATLAGDKTATRRIIRNQPTIGAELICENLLPETVEAGAGAVFAWSDGTVSVAPWAEGDILWVRETWSTRVSDDCFAQPCHLGVCPYESCESPEKSCFPDEYIYKATDSLPAYGGKWHPSIHMPYEAARIFLRVKRVRAQLLNDITIEQVLKEGITREAIESRISPGSSCPRWVYHETAKGCFAKLWNSTIKADKIDLLGWATNPWVWVIDYERCEKPEALE